MFAVNVKSLADFYVRRIGTRMNDTSRVRGAIALVLLYT